jgi:holliday junction DNA helicase RuvB
MSGSPTLSDIGIEREQLKARDRELAKRQREATAAEAKDAEAPTPVGHNERSQNDLRPERLDQVIGQEEAVELLGEVLATAKARQEPLDHVLLIGPAGTGKTTLANCIANESERRCFQLAAPVSLDTLLQLAKVMEDGDVLFVDEIHQQAIMERRGKESISQPEVFLSLLEDFVIATQGGMLPFPRITVIGATTDPGRLPDPFLDRFPIEPVLHPYSERALAVIAENAARRIGLTLMPGVAEMFAAAARRTPRVLLNYVRNADKLAIDRYVVQPIAERVLFKLNGVTSDGLTRDMQSMLLFLYEKCERKMGDGEVRYQASVNTIATGIGLSRDTKAIQLRVEPWLIQAGYVQLGSGGRLLTHDGIWRARQLQEGT